MTNSSVRAILTPSVCEDAGLMPIDIAESLIQLGAMNPDYSKVREVIKQIRNNSSADT